MCMCVQASWVDLICVEDCKANSCSLRVVCRLVCRMLPAAMPLALDSCSADIASLSLITHRLDHISAMRHITNSMLHVKVGCVWSGGLDGATPAKQVCC